MGGRSCQELPSSGCLRCGNTIEGCPGTACVIDAPGIRTITQLNCQGSPPPAFATWPCIGQWALENNSGFRPICTIQAIATGAGRWSVSCGACVTIVEATSPVGVTPIWQSNGTKVALAALQTLPPRTAVPVGPQGAAFHLGAFVRDSDWQLFLQAAQLFVAPAIAPGQAAIFVIFDGQTNALSPTAVERNGDTLTVTIRWIATDQGLLGETPALLYVVDRTGISRVRVRTSPSSELGAFVIPSQ
jgi:hypothetical protein